MTSGSNSNHNTNETLVVRKTLLDTFSNSTVNDIGELKFNWTQNTASLDSIYATLLIENGFAEVANDLLKVNRSGKLFLSRMLIDFKTAIVNGMVIGEKYVVRSKIKIGKNSAIYYAEHKALGYRVVLKLIRPGAAENLIASLKLLNALNSKSQIVRPVDLLTVEVEDVFKAPALVDCVVFPAIDGITLRSFLQQKNYHLNSHIALSFIKQIGGALYDLEQVGAYHGDLHDENIIVEESANGFLAFSVIDVSFGAMGSLSVSDCKNHDLSQFRQHIWRILSLQKSYLPNMSLRKFLGTRQFLAINKILSGRAESFAQIQSYIEGDVDYTKYSEQKAAFLAHEFNQPKTFRLQRYEEIIDPSAAARLFVPFPELMARVSGFSNAYVSGNRGSGKSTYLAALAYFASNSEPTVDIRETFGVYFPCRQGEFKSLRGHQSWNQVEAQERTTAIIIVKIIRRTLEELSDGVTRGQIKEPSDLSQLRTFLNEFIPAPGIVLVQRELLPEMQNFASSMVRVEMEMLSSFRSGAADTSRPTQDRGLIAFFSIIKSLFADLAATRFHILFDDAGAPNLTPDVQKVLCDLILTSNPVFCIKFSAEKFTFNFESSYGKIPENGHDYFEHDISHMLFIGSKSARLASEDLERYFQGIIEQRLEYFGYRSHHIVDYLGDNRSIADQLIGLLAGARKDARYAGWTAVWHIADRTPRNLLEIVSEIFAYADVRPDSEPSQVSAAVQDKAIRAISDKRLQSLSQIAGYIFVGGKKVSLGRRLFEVTASIGSIFRGYLRQEIGKQRKRQHLAIERNDLSDLSPEAGELLRRLISYGVLDDSKSEYARDDVVKKPIYVLNRIYCPAFNIIYRRDEHLRLSRAKFELLLLNPEGFVRYGTKRLVAIASEGETLDGLFGFKIYE